MTDDDAARLGMVRCAREPNTWHLPHRRAPRCDCGPCCYARANGKRVPHTRCTCGGVRK